MVSAHERVFITNPDDYDNYFEMEKLKGEHPELICPQGYNDYGMINQIRIEEQIFCNGRSSHQRPWDKSPNPCLTCEKYVHKPKTE